MEQYLPADTPRLEVTASDDGAILSMVAAGLGVSVLSVFSLAGYEKQVKVIPLDRPLSRRLGVAVKAMPGGQFPGPPVPVVPEAAVSGRPARGEVKKERKAVPG